MGARCPELPFLPGYTFNPNIGKTRFPMDPKFDFIGDGISCLKEKVKPNMLGPLSDKYPSIYARGEVSELPGWIAFDKQILCFEAFFQESLHEFQNCPFIIRKVKIYFFLEDGTIQVIEPKVENSGIAQGTMISRQRIRFPAPMDENFYDIIDFNVGREVELYGKVFKITNCDKFTRVFLNRLGISVPDPINAPDDPYMKVRCHDRDQQMAKHPNRNTDTLGKFLENDRKILKFYGYWDDQDRDFGILHHLEVYFFLSDDTVEIKDILPENSGTDCSSMLVKRAKLPKVYKSLPGPGSTAPYTVLNVLGEGLQTGRYVVDPLDCGKEHIEYYKENDLAIGGVLNCYGRRIVLTDCDPYTKEYYRVKYGIDDFTPLETPKDKCAPVHTSTTERELPPWNGYGTHEDSAQNCVTVELKPPLKDLRKFLKYDRVGLDSYNLRFEARMLSKIDANCNRIFIISFYLSDDTISVYEIARGNSGFARSMFFAREKIPLPGQGTFTSKAPLCYTPQHMFVGATLIINSFYFILIDADEYCFRYMELNEQEFPKSNLCLIMTKVREKLRPIYKDFVGEMIPGETGVISYEMLRNKLCKIMGSDFTEHEMITIARGFSANCQKEKYNRETIRAITLTELKRYLWDDLERLTEYFKKRDVATTGKLSKKECYTLLKGCRLPVDNELIEKIFSVIQKDDQCNFYYEDLLKFLDRNICPMTDVRPLNIKYELSWLAEREPETGTLINWCAFNDCLDLEHIFKEPIVPAAHEKPGEAPKPT